MLKEQSISLTWTSDDGPVQTTTSPVFKEAQHTQLKLEPRHNNIESWVHAGVVTFLASEVIAASALSIYFKDSMYSIVFSITALVQAGAYSQLETIDHLLQHTFKKP